MGLKFKKVKNQDIWEAPNGTDIIYDPIFNEYSIERNSFFAFAKTLRAAKRIANTDLRFAKA